MKKGLSFMKHIPILTASLIILLTTATAMVAASPFVVIAHRGASGYLPEHTLESKALAHGMNPDFIEQDVSLTKDNVPIVIHDHYLDTVSNVKDLFPERKRADGRYYVIDFTVEEIRRLTACERIDLKTGKAVFPGRYPVPESNDPKAVKFTIPTLQEEITLIQGLNKSRHKNIGLYVELKAPWFHREEGRDIAGTVLKVLNDFGYHDTGDTIFIQCFDPVCLKKLKFIHRTKIPLVQLIADNSWNETPGVDYTAMLTPQGMKRVSTYADGIGPWIPQLIKVSKQGKISVTHVVENAHRAGLVVHPYTVRKDALPEGFTSMNALVKALYYKGKIDGIFSDFPDTAVTFRDTLK